MCGASPGGLARPSDVTCVFQGAQFAASVLVPDTNCRTVSHVSAPGDARETVDNGPTPWADPWVLAPTASGASLAFALVTGCFGSLPELTRAPPIKLGTGLAPTFAARLGALAFWLHGLLLVACVVVLLKSGSQSRVPFWMSTGKLPAGALMMPQAFCSSNLPLSDYVHRVATTSQHKDSDSYLGRAGTGFGDSHQSSNGHNNRTQDSQP
jgi:hypothetical protein